MKNMADVYKKMPQDFPEDPVAVMKRNIYISPFWEEDLIELAGLIGEDHVLFGSDYRTPKASLIRRVTSISSRVHPKRRSARSWVATSLA